MGPLSALLCAACEIATDSEPARLAGISQRDTNHYPHMLAADVQSKVRNALSRFFDETVRSKFPGGPDCAYNLVVTMVFARLAARMLTQTAHRPY